MVLLMSVLLAAGCSSVRDGPAGAPRVLAEFPFYPNTGWILLPVTFEGQQYPFVLDTGCTRTIFDDSFKDRLGKRFLWPRKSRAADGKRFTVEYFHAPEAFVGPLKMGPDGLILAADVTRISLDSQIRIHGIVGMDFLKHYVVQVDPDRGSVTFLRSQRGAARSQWGKQIRMRRKFRSSVPCVKGQINGIRETFLVDTGCTGLLSGSLKRSVFEKIRSGSHSVKYRSVTANMAQAAVPRSGSVVFPDTLSLDGVVFRDTAFREGHDSLLGLPFFSGHIVTFDFPNDRLYLRPAQNREAWGGGEFRLAHLGFSFSRRRGGLSVSAVDSDGIAYRKGVRQDDLLVKVHGRGVSGATPIGFLKSVLQHGKSEGDAAATLTFRRGDVVRDVSFIRSDLMPKEREAD
ncbi:MAG: aspartyl protease family protein [Sedimentisphaerales bacterium]|nr:aspartyl protease family protein [Sedimentisphaerales bacterium]